jgi:lipoate-protein ligase A
MEKRAREIAAVVTSVREAAGDAVGMGDLCRAVAAGFEDVLHVRLAEGTLSPEEDALKEKLLADKYSRDEWNLKGWNDRRGS